MENTTEKTTNQDVIDSFSIDKMFNTEEFINNQEEEIDLSEYDGLSQSVPGNEATDQNELDNDDLAQGKEEEEDDGFNFDADNQSEEDKEIDLETFNKKFNQNFQNEEELKSFLNEKEEKNELEQETEAYEKANSAVESLAPLLELEDYDLMKRYIQYDFQKQGKDLSDEDVQIEVEDELQLLVDNRILDTKASVIRNNFKNAYEKALQTKTTFESKKEELKAQAEKAEREELQNKFVELYSTKSFFGLDLDKNTIQDVYRDVASNKFIERLQSDKGAIAELALMSKLKEQIYKKASGLTYNDGLKAVLDEFKNAKSKSPVVAAQKRGTAGSSDQSDDLINSVIYGDKAE